MAKDAKSAASNGGTTAVSFEEESQQLAHFKFREKELEAKLKALDEHPETTAHDLAGARKRTELALKEVRAEIKRLEKK